MCVWPAGDSLLFPLSYLFVYDFPTHTGAAYISASLVPLPFPPLHVSHVHVPFSQHTISYVEPSGQTKFDKNSQVSESFNICIVYFWVTLHLWFKKLGYLPFGYLMFILPFKRNRESVILNSNKKDLYCSCMSYFHWKHLCHHFHSCLKGRNTVNEGIKISHGKEESMNGCWKACMMLENFVGYNTLSEGHKNVVISCLQSNKESFLKIRGQC